MPQCAIGRTKFKQRVVLLQQRSQGLAQAGITVPDVNRFGAGAVDFNNVKIPTQPQAFNVFELDVQATIMIARYISKDLIEGCKQLLADQICGVSKHSPARMARRKHQTIGLPCRDKQFPIRLVALPIKMLKLSSPRIRCNQLGQRTESITDNKRRVFKCKRCNLAAFSMGMPDIEDSGLSIPLTKTMELNLPSNRKF